MTNSLGVFGSCAASFSSVLHSRNACFVAGKYFHKNIHGFTCRILLIGVINFFPLGLLLLHVRFSNQFSIRLNGTPFFMRTIFCSSISIAIYLSRASSMHRVAPSTIQPSTSFLTDHRTSPESNLFLDIGSCPLCPETFSNGKTRRIPFSYDIDNWSNRDGSLVCAMCIKLSQNTFIVVQNGFSSNRVNLFSH